MIHKDDESIEYSISLIEVILGTKFVKTDFENALNLARAYSETADVKDIEKSLVCPTEIPGFELNFSPHNFLFRNICTAPAKMEYQFKSTNVLFLIE